MNVNSDASAIWYGFCRPYGTRCGCAVIPRVETRGYSLSSLRDSIRSQLNYVPHSVQNGDMFQAPPRRDYVSPFGPGSLCLCVQYDAMDMASHRDTKPPRKIIPRVLPL